VEKQPKVVFGQRVLMFTVFVFSPAGQTVAFWTVRIIFYDTVIDVAPRGIYLTPNFPRNTVFISGSRNRGLPLGAAALMSTDPRGE